MPDQPTPAPAPKRLYVICHGAIAMLQTDKNLTLKIPDMGATHSYRVGTWLAETTIQKGVSLALQNVTGGTASVPNLLSSNQTTSASARPPYATFTLPRPIQVFSLFQATISKDILKPGPGGSALKADLVVPYLPVLEYSYLSKPSLGNVWPAYPGDLNGLPDDPLTLHIYAEDEIDLDDAHAVEAFNLSCQLLGMNISLSPPANGPWPVKPGPLLPAPPGLENRCFEFEPLSVRRESLLLIARAKQNLSTVTDPWSSVQCGDLNALGYEFFWPLPDIQHHGNASCLPLMVGISATANPTH